MQRCECNALGAKLGRPVLLGAKKSLLRTLTGHQKHQSAQLVIWFRL